MRQGEWECASARKTTTEEAIEICKSHKDCLHRYHKAISSLNMIVESLLSKNEFLSHDRALLLQENNTIKIERNDIQDAIQGEPMHDSFQKETLFLKIYSQDGANPSKSESNLLSSAKFLQSNECQIVNNFRCNATFQGIIRCFYFNALKNQQGKTHLKQIAESYRQQETFILYDAFPCNNFAVDIIVNFLNTPFLSLDSLADHLNKFTLIDELICKLLKNRISGMVKLEPKIQSSFDRYLMEPTEENGVIAETFIALGNQFDMRMQFENQVYTFYEFEENSYFEASFKKRSLSKNQPLFMILQCEKYFQIICTGKVNKEYQFVRCSMRESKECFQDIANIVEVRESMLMSELKDSMPQTVQKIKRVPNQERESSMLLSCSPRMNPSIFLLETPDSMSMSDIKNFPRLRDFSGNFDNSYEKNSELLFSDCESIFECFQEKISMKRMC